METVRFSTGLPYNGRIFYQPLFYLAENHKQSINKAHDKEFDNQRLDVNCGEFIYSTLTPIKLESSSFIGSKDDTKLFYIIQAEDNRFKFTYKGVQFQFEGLDNSKLGDRMIKEKRDDIVIYSSYQISFESKYMDIFETWLKTCISYWDKFYNNDKEDTCRISIFLTASEGFYFQYLGKRHKRNIDSIYLPKKQKAEIIGDMEKFLRPETRSRYLKLGINHKRVYLLEGIPGSGKTSLITALASKFNFNIAIVSFTPKMTDMDLLRLLRSISTTDEDDNLQDTLSTEKKKKTSLLVFEDIDCIFRERKSHDENKNGITFSGLLNALDGITSNENMVCFITTNYKSHLDSALLRPGRVDYIMRFDYSTKEQIQDMFRDFTGCDEKEKLRDFYTACSELKIKISTSLLQQYLMKYMDLPDDALSNVDEMKTMFEKAKIDKEADETGLFS